METAPVAFFEVWGGESFDFVLGGADVESCVVSDDDRMETEIFKGGGEIDLVDFGATEVGGVGVTDDEDCFHGGIISC